MIWGEINEQPKPFQVLKTSIKLYISILPSVAEELKTSNPPIGVALICDDLNGAEYHFRQGTEIQKVQVKKNLASFKVLINPITKLKKEATYNPFLPLHPSARKAKPRFWLRVFWGNYPPIDTCKFYLFIRRDEQRIHEEDYDSISDMNLQEEPIHDKSSSTSSISTEYFPFNETDKQFSILSTDPPPDFASLKKEGAFVKYKRSNISEQEKTVKKEEDTLDQTNLCQHETKENLKSQPKPIVFNPVLINNQLHVQNPFILHPYPPQQPIHEKPTLNLTNAFPKTFLSLLQKLDTVQICTQVIKPYIALKIDRNESFNAIKEGFLDIELIWSFQKDKIWKTISIPNGVYYETTKNFSTESDVIVFKHAHVNNWTIIKNFVKNYIPKTLWKENFLKHHYGFRFHIRSSATSYGCIEMPFLFQIDIRRENDPNYIPKGKRMNEKYLDGIKRQKVITNN